MDFSKFDEQVNVKELARGVEEAIKNGGGDFPVIPAGEYMTKLEKLELGNTKDGRPMVKAQFKIIEGEYKNQRLFYNRVIYGTKNDANMIASALGFLDNLEPSEEVGPVMFQSYNQFADLILDIAEDVYDTTHYNVEYDPDAFNSISVLEAFDA